MGKYSPAQLAKSTAGGLTALVTFLGSLSLILADVVPADWGWAGGLALASAFLTRMAVYLVKSAPTLAQVEANVEQVIELIRQIKPDVLAK